MKAVALIKDLNRMVEQHGPDVEVWLQDSPPGAHPECCKHGEFFVVEEPSDGAPEKGMEIVLRTWPY